MSPLIGRTVVVTRATDQAGSLSTALADHGAKVVELPVVSIEESVDGGEALSAALARADCYDWIVVTSPNGARRVADGLAGPTTARLAARPRRPATSFPTGFETPDGRWTSWSPTGMWLRTWIRRYESRPGRPTWSPSPPSRLSAGITILPVVRRLPWRPVLARSAPPSHDSLGLRSSRPSPTRWPG